MPVIEYDSEVKVIDKAWSPVDADSRWRGASKSELSPSRRYRAGFSWFDNDKPEKFPSYKLQIRDTDDGEEVVNLAAVRSAMEEVAALEGPNGAEKEEIRYNLQQYLNRGAGDNKTADSAGADDAKSERNKEISMDLEKIQAEAKAEERKRIAGLEKIAAGFPASRELVDAAIESGQSAGDILSEAMAAQKSKEIASQKIADAIEDSKRTESIQADRKEANEDNPFRILFRAQGLKIKE